MCEFPSTMDFSCLDAAACEPEDLMGMASFAPDFGSSSRPFGVQVNFIQSRTLPVLPRPCILDNLRDQPNSLCIIGKIIYKHLRQLVKNIQKVDKHLQWRMNACNANTYNKNDHRKSSFNNVCIYSAI